MTHRARGSSAAALNAQEASATHAFSFGWNLAKLRLVAIDLVLCWPDFTLRGAPRLVRIGGSCQKGFGVPAITISMLLLDGSVGDALHAIAIYRPDLLHRANRGSLPSATFAH